MKKEASSNRFIYLFRHGETEWSRDGRHTSYTDIPLTTRGREQARALAGVFATTTFAAIFCSPRRRAVETAEIAGQRDRVELTEELSEWNYGDYEGRTTEQIRRTEPGWTVWTHPCPNGETPEQVATRADALIARAAHFAGNLAFVSHAHLLRVLAARWLREPPELGRHLILDAASYSILGYEHDERAIVSWNILPPT
jgi:probable phosphoglycerate mutase